MNRSSLAGAYVCGRGAIKSSGRKSVADLLVLGLELQHGGLRLHDEQGGKILVGHAVADHLLDEVARNRGERHRHLELAGRVEPEIHVLAQQMWREGDAEIQIHERRRLVTAEGRAHHALVEEIEKS